MMKEKDLQDINVEERKEELAPEELDQIVGGNGWFEGLFGKNDFNGINSPRAFGDARGK